jgi:predicted dehydrogenase
MKNVRFGLIGCGLMGREFASALARWCHLLADLPQPQLVAVCNRSPGPFDWFRQHFPALNQFTQDYRQLLENTAVDAVYLAVPHHLHEEIGCACIRSGKHTMLEKPAGIDLAANQAILRAAEEHPETVVRCASQWPFYPAAQRLGRAVAENVFGTIIEVNAGFLHSSDLDPNKPINWKRKAQTNGAYGVMGDLGMHVCAVPFRAGWMPANVRAVLSNIVTQRPNSTGQLEPCDTWDNATLLCEGQDRSHGTRFPMTLRMHRIAPGQKNTWYLEVLGTKTSARFSTRNPKQLEWLDYRGGEQVWGEVEVGYETAYKTITGPIFEFGFPDAILQMWAAFVRELSGEASPGRFAGCVTLEETALSHRLFTAALRSYERQAVEPVA